MPCFFCRIKNVTTFVHMWQINSTHTASLFCAKLSRLVDFLLTFWYMWQIYSAHTASPFRAKLPNNIAGYLFKHSTCSTLRVWTSHTLQHTATHCHTLPHTATHCHTLPHTAIHCNTLQHHATHCNTLWQDVLHPLSLDHAQVVGCCRVL